MKSNNSKINLKNKHSIKPLKMPLWIPFGKWCFLEMFTFSHYSAALNINILMYVQRSAIVENQYNKKSSYKSFKNTKVYYLQLTGLTVNVVLKYFKFATLNTEITDVQ